MIAAVVEDDDVVLAVAVVDVVSAADGGQCKYEISTCLLSGVTTDSGTETFTRWIWDIVNFKFGSLIIVNNSSSRFLSSDDDEVLPEQKRIDVIIGVAINLLLLLLLVVVENAETLFFFVMQQHIGLLESEEYDEGTAGVGGWCCFLTNNNAATLTIISTLLSARIQHHNSSRILSRKVMSFLTDNSIQANKKKINAFGESKKARRPSSFQKITLTIVGIHFCYRYLLLEGLQTDRQTDRQTDGPVNDPNNISKKQWQWHCFYWRLVHKVANLKQMLLHACIAVWRHPGVAQTPARSTVNRNSPAWGDTKARHQMCDVDSVTLK